MGSFEPKPKDGLLLAKGTLEVYMLTSAGLITAHLIEFLKSELSSSIVWNHTDASLVVLW